ncbi:ABC transporter permease subunit [Actinomadura sp. 7K507]|uniref:ABC transporter permease n=1 Tax=Actinomadura sp. 7K507 TaxID=2530365 RepID=UPI0010479606|nr:ABC transporter permease subunit [Actinomadura sp. 7K507]TDC92035.1 ABC transporter permease subunit [Actinomadura sp. 7K507]
MSEHGTGTAVLGERGGAGRGTRDRAPVPGDGAARPGRRRILAHLLADGVPLLLLAVWFWYSTNVSAAELPNPVEVGRESIDLLIGEGAVHTWTSMGRIVLAVLLATCIGSLLVFLAGVAPVTELLIGKRVLPFFNSVPALGWAILGVIWFGVGDFSVVFVVTAITIPFCLVNLWEGKRALDPGLLEMGRSFTRSRVRVLFAIELPLLVPYIFAAARLSFSVGWKVALIAEFFGSQTGLGLVMNRARQSFDSPTVFATIVVVLLIVSVVERLLFDPLAHWFAKRTGTAVAR